MMDRRGVRVAAMWRMVAGLAACGLWLLASMPAGTAAEPAVGGKLDLSGYHLTFDEEFNSFSAAPPGIPAKWETAYFYGARKGPGYLLDLSVGGLGQTPYSLKDGILTIESKATTPELRAAGVADPFTTGQIDTHASFSQRYGYFEMRAQVPGVVGSSSAFWLLPPSGPWPPEIDIMEVAGQGPNDLATTNHFGRTGIVSSDYFDAGDLSRGMHVYGLLWTPTNLTWFLDGRAVFTAPTAPDEQQPMYMLVSLYTHTERSWLQRPKDPSAYRARYRIDWVHAYSSGPHTRMIAGEAGYQDHDGSASLGSAPPGPE
jgi:hypothetical protein